ncbi:hypothetical protein NLM24_28500 [Nocardia zapadnayensis]|uniref:hypothetical protein n=1 Tax=Nocardia rhamnosiphila TaxID=426716 RepID=UPI00224721CA|nr:hypothetical protein [Nocardia zapadnayensis]MCX0274562.1 hypothetical protein [Nocardia zapadnayensis]
MLFDIRTIVGSLLGLYGIILVITGLVHDTVDEEAKTGGINVNLWAGLALVVVAAAFVTWALLRPVAVDRPGRESAEDSTAPGAD